jgi:hypothetical protein
LERTARFFVESPLKLAILGMIVYICGIEVVSTLIGRLINYIKNTETRSGNTMAGRKPAMVAHAQRITKETWHSNPV